MTIGEWSVLFVLEEHFELLRGELIGWQGREMLHEALRCQIVIIVDSVLGCDRLALGRTGHERQGLQGMYAVISSSAVIGHVIFEVKIAQYNEVETVLDRVFLVAFCGCGCDFLCSGLPQRRRKRRRSRMVASRFRFCDAIASDRGLYRESRSRCCDGKE